MAVLENGDKKYSSLLEEVETGQIKIPQFQRQFVWDISSSAKLIDSILKGYPIGTFIFWRTNERLRAIRNIGNIKLTEPKDGEYVNYVLDGQQRITSVFASLKGQQIERDNGKFEDFSKIYIDLDANIDEKIVITDINDKKEHTYIKLTDLMYEKGRILYNKYPDEYGEKIDKYKEIIQSYLFRGVNLKDAEIDVATEVFTRLNVGGKDLSLFEIMVAKTYDHEKEFDLYEKFQELKQELQPSKYDTISSATILQLVSILIKKECTRKVILKLSKEEFINKWDDATECLKSAVDFFRSYGIPVSRLLPYNALLVPFSYFFYKHKTNPTGEIKEKLEDFFWRVSLGYRYSSAVESKLANDIEKIDKIINNELPKYEWSIDISPENLRNDGYFSTGRSFIKAILCLYAMQKPKSFDNGLDVNIDNSWLKIANSKNYHHFFPKSYMEKNQQHWEYWQYNNILNITIVDGYLNKNKIRAKAPSVYMKSFSEDNSALEETMKTHLIDDLNSFGVWSDDYERFFNERAKIVSKELYKKIIAQDTTGIVLETYEEYEEDLEDGGD
ncbi:GmrSD restriction endonuclease domain-containing protein [Aliarcobacter butzleri]|uniref:GmrSD restriction endonuclease domain-containing protein n=1 Tax=Aliarcobacter butzleri TaxID=28197 RepID=UPI002B254430|nr:DUF262 domain-containing protein [Aliarcobacter butzleri]